jgi:enamine deaminase RidA (YjgF/YER057c/UK114 family)
VSGAGCTIYVGGQNGIGPDGSVVSQQVGEQTTRALQNVELVLVESGADLGDIVSWTIQIVEGQPLGPAFEAFQGAWGDRANPPTVSVAFVSGLANPSFLVEITAVAVLPGDSA